jgi:hypothetical protein
MARSVIRFKNNKSCSFHTKYDFHLSSYEKIFITYSPLHTTRKKTLTNSRKTLKVHTGTQFIMRSLKNIVDPPSVQTHWTSLAGVVRVKNKGGKEMTSMKSPKNTTQLKRRRHIRNLKNNYILFSFWNIQKYGCIPIKFNGEIEEYKFKCNIAI